jgi:hypothetical protein
MIASGMKRSRDFSWSAHVEQILELSQRLIRADRARTKNGHEPS